VHFCSPDDQIKTNDCSTVLRRFTGPEAHEISALFQPDGRATDVTRQAEAVYGATLDLLAAEGAPLETLACETVYLRNIREDLPAVLDARSRVLARAGKKPAKKN